MRFITEFVLSDTEIKYARNPTEEYRKACGERNMGIMLAESFGWQERGETTIHDPVQERFTLEIEAFPIDKWREFKNELKKWLELDYEKRFPGTFNLIMVGKLIKELESFGKPSGDTITNNI